MPKHQGDAKAGDWTVDVLDSGASGRNINATSTLPADNLLMQRYLLSGTLTADRTLTLPDPTNIQTGTEISIIRAATTPGAFSWTVANSYGLGHVFPANRNGFVRYVTQGGVWRKVAAGLYDEEPLTGTAAPTVTPKFVGQRFFDLTNKKVYVAFGTTSSSDWGVLN